MCRVERVGALHGEDVQVHAARPQHAVGDAVGLQVAQHHGRGRHHRLCGAVEPVQEAVRPCQRNGEARLHVLRKARVVRRREGQLVAQRIRTRGQAERPLRGDMQRLRRERLDAPAHPLGRQDRQPDFRIRRARHRREFERRDHVDDVPHGFEFATRRREGADDSVDLRFPGIGDDHDFHGCSLGHGCRVGGGGLDEIDCGHGVSGQAAAAAARRARREVLGASSRCVQ